MKKILSCDWGTSSFRLRLVNANTQEIVSEVVSKQGIAEIYQNWRATGMRETERIGFYTNILRGAMQHLPNPIDPDTPIFLSGMASSTMGLLELPYQNFPLTWDIAPLPIQKIDGNTSFPYPLYVLSGFKTDTDIMRGEETLLLGCDVDDNSERIFILPGTHSKHVWVNNKTAVNFKTFMTGEVFNLLATQSVLGHSVAKGDDLEAFSAGVKAAFTHDNLLHNAFLVRTRHILNQSSPLSNYAYLSGLLIGSEIKDLPLDMPIYLVCGEQLQQSYKIALEERGMKNAVVVLNADEALVKGHCRIANYFL